MGDAFKSKCPDDLLAYNLPVDMSLTGLPTRHQRERSTGFIIISPKEYT